MRPSAVAIMVALPLAACGATQPRQSIAARVCQRTLAGARRVLGDTARVRVASSQPADIECVASGSGMTAEVEAQASPRAWTQYDTTVVHLAQAFSGIAQRRRYLPQQVQGVAPQAIWVPAQGQLVATNGTQSRGGTYLTVTVTGREADGPRGLALARALARETVPVAPKGPSPGPAPS